MKNEGRKRWIELTWTEEKWSELERSGEKWREEEIGTEKWSKKERRAGLGNKAYWREKDTGRRDLSRSALEKRLEMAG